VCDIEAFEFAVEPIRGRCMAAAGLQIKSRELRRPGGGEQASDQHGGVGKVTITT
jgi:hypothetical protein